MVRQNSQRHRAGQQTPQSINRLQRRPRHQHPTRDDEYPLDDNDPRYEKAGLAPAHPVLLHDKGEDGSHSGKVDSVGQVEEQDNSRYDKPVPLSLMLQVAPSAPRKKNAVTTLTTAESKS